MKTLFLSLLLAVGIMCSAQVRVHEYQDASVDVVFNSGGEQMLHYTYNQGFFHNNLFGFNYRVSYGASTTLQDQFWFQAGIQYKLDKKLSPYGQTLTLYPLWFRGYIGSDYETPIGLAYGYYGHPHFKIDFMVNYHDYGLDYSLRLAKFVKW